MNARAEPLFRAFAETLADAARDITRRYFRRPLDIAHKADDSPVTVADRETEAELRRLIRSRFPDHGILGEEQGRTEGAGRYLWVIDPIDGTKSFITGLPLFGTLIALLDSGRPVLGVIDMPLLDERWVGAAGMPTLCNGAPVTASGVAALPAAVLYTTSPDTFRTPGEKAGYDALSAAVRLRRFGGDCYIYGLLASGFVDLALEAQLQPYDYLALVPVVEGAGGRISDWQGRALGLDSDGRVLATASAALHDQALSLLNKG